MSMLFTSTLKEITAFCFSTLYLPFFAEFIAGFRCRIWEWPHEWPKMTQKILHRNSASNPAETTLRGGWKIFSFCRISMQNSVQDFFQIAPTRVRKSVSQQNDIPAEFWGIQDDGQKFCNKILHNIGSNSAVEKQGLRALCTQEQYKKKV